MIHSYATVTSHSAFFYVDKRKVQNYMTENSIDIREYNMVQSNVSLLASGQLKASAVNGSSHGENNMNENSKVWIDSNSCCLALYSKLGEDQVLMLQSPIALPKAMKSPTELDGLRKAHIRDGAAVVQYLAWLDNQLSTILLTNEIDISYSIGFVCAHTLPVLYEKYENQFDDFLYSCLGLL
ncbi:hypothetical protein ABZP36_013251 [Zizania latifolia]